MDDPYYTQRKRIIDSVPDSELGEDFWIALRTYIDRLTEENYLCQSFPGRCSDGYPIGRDDEVIAARLREEFGRITWPIPPQGRPETQRIFDLLEFFFRHVAKPTKSSYHSYCDGFHPEEYDVAQGRYKYTVEINAMLRRFNYPYRLQKGRIVRIGNELIDDWILATNFRTSDEHLLHLINTAVNNFYDKSGKKKLEGLRSLADALERLKSMEGADKKRSVEKVVAKLSPVEDIRLHFEEHLRKMTGFSNKYTIRHHEIDKTTLTDDTLVDYLFYSYYNLIVFIMRRYGLVSAPD